MNHKVCVIGLGYVGLPLAVEFSKKYETIGFDINKDRVNQLKNNIDLTEEAIVHELLHIRYSTENEDWINETTRQHLHSKYKY